MTLSLDQWLQVGTGTFLLILLLGLAAALALVPSLNREASVTAD